MRTCVWTCFPSVKDLVRTHAAMREENVVGLTGMPCWSK